MRGGLPSAWVPRCPCSGRSYFATEDNDPSFITDISLKRPRRSGRHPRPEPHHHTTRQPGRSPLPTW